MSNKDDIENESMEPFDPTTATDAGEAEESIQATEESRKVGLRAVENKANRENYAEDVRQEPDIILRGRKLMQGNLVSFPDIKKTADGYIALSSDSNRYAAFEALFGEGEGRPHINTFSGRLVDWKGMVIDDMYSMAPLVKACHHMGLRQQSFKVIRDSLRDWGMQVKQNDMIVQFKRLLPEWDGVPRMEMKVINLFECFDTPLNRRFSVYFWLSLYCRINYPGCLAPMILSLFGPQDAGKSYFSVIICRTLMNDPRANSVPLDMAGDRTNFLRSITGKSLIANIGEMTGFTRADLNDIKDFTTRVSDDMHQKFEGHYDQLRQWISILDGNAYEGLQRDSTGNRRFYPMFVGQIPDVNGQPAWREDFKADFTGFEGDIWQIMAECKQWLEDNNGLEGYREYVGKVSKEVKEFSQVEMAAARGIIKDSALETYLIPALSKLAALDAEIVEGRVKRGVWITTAKLKSRIRAMSRGSEIKDNHLKNHMTALGAEPEMIANCRGYLFRGVMTEEDYAKIIHRGETDDDTKVIARFEQEDGF